jgi:hypothetical protein
MGYGEGSMKRPFLPLAKRRCPTSVGDLVGFVGDLDGFIGYGVVVRAYPHNSVVRWVNTGQYASEKNTNLYIIAEGSMNVSRST